MVPDSLLFAYYNNLPALTHNIVRSFREQLTFCKCLKKTFSLPWVLAECTGYYGYNVRHAKAHLRWILYQILI